MELLRCLGDAAKMTDEMCIRDRCLMMRRVTDNVICGATWAAAVISGWFLMAGVRYYRDIPQGFPYYAAERLDDLRLKGIIWIIVAAVMFLSLIHI